MQRILDQHIDEAKRWGHAPPRLFFCRTPEQIIDHCDAELQRIGFEQRTKNNDSGFSSTRFGSVLWSKDLANSSPVHRAKVYAHETTHAIQSTRYAMWGAKYLLPRWGWIFEMQAYRVGMLALQLCDLSEFELRKEADRVTRSLWENYPQIRLLRHSHYRRHTEPLLLDAVGLRP